MSRSFAWILALWVVGCSPSPRRLGLEDFVRVGVDPHREAEEVQRSLEEAEWEVTQRLEGDGWVAIALRRDELRAVRVVSSRGVVVALDSHEPDEFRPRHGNVRLVEVDPADIDGDGRVDVVVGREEDGVLCLAVLRIAADGAASRVSDDANALHEGACVERLEDVDGDGSVEALVPLRWPDLAMGDDVAAVDVPLVLGDGGFRADGMPVVVLERERSAREASLAAARARRDVSGALQRAVELAALAHLAGAPIASQVARFDRALSGLVLSETERDRVAEVRAVIASGWRAP